MPSVETHRIILAHGEPEAASRLGTAIRALGHALEASVETSAELIDAAELLDPDLLISSTRLRDGPGIDALLRVSPDRPKPAIIVAPPDDLVDVQKALRDHVMAYLVEPVDDRDLQPAIQLVMVRFREFQALRGEVEDLQAALRARKLIERAKGLIMKQHGLDEAAAFRRLQRAATDGRKKLVDVAEALILAEGATTGDS